MAKSPQQGKGTIRRAGPVDTTRLAQASVHEFPDTGIGLAERRHVTAWKFMDLEWGRPKVMARRRSLMLRGFLTCERSQAATRGWS